MLIDLTNEVQAVKAFHLAFNHPVGNEQPTPLIQERLVTRMDWVLRELYELSRAKTIVEQVDALCDCAYFLCGNLVEMGIHAFSTHMSIDMLTRPRSAEVTPFLKRMNPPLLSCVQQESLLPQVMSLRVMLAEVVNFHNDSLGVSFWDIFAIVHSTNMAKLWPDGKPRYAKDGKVMKPPNWIAPEARIEAYLSSKQITN